MKSRVVVLLSLLLGLGACGDHAPVEASAEAADRQRLGPAEATAKNLADAGPRGDPERGEAIYNKSCLSCHQADGKGMNGALAANFVEDESRLAKPDSVLLESIAKGKQGKMASMPPQENILSEQERKDALAYIRATFGASSQR